MHTQGGVSLMTPKQILDSFSETLMKDEHILSAQERALIATLLQHAKLATGGNLETQEAVRKVIASAIGETVAQRAFAVLGGSVVERILESSSLPEAAVSRTTEMLDLSGPQTPGTPRRESPMPPGPQTPGAPRRDTPMPPGPQTPGTPRRDTPIPPGPQTPGHGVTKTVVSQAAAAVAERPENLPARCVVLDEFLAPQELAELTQFTLEHEADFYASEVLSPTAEDGVVNSDHRRSRVLRALRHHPHVILVMAQFPKNAGAAMIVVDYPDLRGWR